VPEPEDRYDRLILWIVKRVPGRAVAILAAISYFGFGLALPLVLDWPKIWLVSANLWGSLFAVSLLFGWLFVQLQARDRRHLLEWTSDLRLLDAEEFEWLVGELFRREGWKVTERGRQDAADGNIDLELIRGSERRLVQCKRWMAKWVGVAEVRGFLGTLAGEKLQMTAGIFVTLAGFTQQARDLADKSGLPLIDSRELFERVERVRRAELCKTCQSPMLLDHSIHGWWFRCVTPDCGGKRHLDSDPGRAVALLTNQS
jgi:Restriction endonuclease